MSRRISSRVVAWFGLSALKHRGFGCRVEETVDRKECLLCFVGGPAEARFCKAMVLPLNPLAAVGAADHAADPDHPHTTINL